MALAVVVTAHAAGPPLVVEHTITLPDVKGRIDHMAIDLGRHRLIVAELGNDSVEVIDLTTGKILHRIGGLNEPQGVAYAKRGDEILVANGGDGSVRFFAAADFNPIGRLALGDDADNIHIDTRNDIAVVAFGSGGLALIDPASRTILGEILLPAHPEGFSLDPANGRAYVNIPDLRQTAVIDLDRRRVVAMWPMHQAGANFPLALDHRRALLASAFRSPPALMLFDATTGTRKQRLGLCGDADDVFFDDRRQRLYVSCGAGELAVFERSAAGWSSIARVPTTVGARTALFVPEIDRLFVAERAPRLGLEAAIRVYRPAP
ncbi:MAG: YncE family protein [Acetobacteraceae bacterium]